MASKRTVSSATSEARADWRVLLALWILPLVGYVGLIGRWSMDTDELYTYFDSQQTVAEILNSQIKPLYYLLCHFLLRLDLGLPREFVIRFPAALAASLAAPVYYALLASPRGPRHAFCTSLIVLCNAWLFEMSQFARYYSLAFLFASISAISLYRWLADRRTRWVVVYVVAGVLATLTHSPAAIVFPAGLAAIGLALFLEDSASVLRWGRRYGVQGGIAGVTVVILVFVAVRPALMQWYGSAAGQFGNYNVPQLLVALIIFGGIANWALAALPLCKPLRHWQPDEVFLASIVVLGIVPFLLLVPIGGGVASRYLLFSLPCMFILAGLHWSVMDAKLPAWGHRLGLGVAVLAFNVPYLASVASDGNHFDYRETANVVEAMELDNPIVLSSSHRMLRLYLVTDLELHELGTFESGVPKSRVEKLMHRAHQEQRPLIIVSREDRSNLSPADQDWLYSRFTLVYSSQSQRFDHRRFRMSIYRYRPWGTQPKSEAPTDISEPSEDQA